MLECPGRLSGSYIDERYDVSVRDLVSRFFLLLQYIDEQCHQKSTAVVSIYREACACSPFGPQKDACASSCIAMRMHFSMHPEVASFTLAMRSYSTIELSLTCMAFTLKHYYKASAECHMIDACYILN